MRKVIALSALMVSAACGTTNQPDTGGLDVLNASNAADHQIAWAIDETFAVGGRMNLDGYTLIVYSTVDETLKACDGHFICLNTSTQVLTMTWLSDDIPQSASWVAWAIGLVKYGATSGKESNPEWFDYQNKQSVVGLVYDNFGGERFYYNPGQGLL